MSSAPSSAHVFRYEPALCTLAEGQTLAEWRRGDDRPQPRSGGGLRAKLRGAKPSARRQSGR